MGISESMATMKHAIFAINFRSAPTTRRWADLVQIRIGTPLNGPMKGRFWPALAIALLAGCTSLAPPYQQPALPVAEQYPYATSTTPATLQGPGTQPGDAAELRLSDYFSAPELRAWIALALQNNRDLRLAAWRVQEARAAHGIQRSAQYPTLGAGAEGVRARTPGDLNPSGAALTASQYQVGAGINGWELDFFGRLQNLNQAALQEFLATDAARRALHLSLIAQVAQRYLAIQELDERILLAQRAEHSQRESLRIFTRRMEVGVASRLEVTQVQSLLAQAEALALQLQQTRALEAHALALLVGTPVEVPSLYVAGREMGPVAAPIAELDPGLPAALLYNRPDIVAAEHRLRGANANIGAARAAFFPRITLTAFGGSASAELDGLFGSGSRAWRFAPSLELPLFDAGRRQANLDLAQARRHIAVAQYEQTIQRAFREVADALASQTFLQRQLQVQERALSAQAERVRLATLSYDNGATTFLEVLDAQRSLLSAEQQLVQARAALQAARVALYSALGGGSARIEAAAQPGAIGNDGQPFSASATPPTPQPQR